MQPEVQIKPFGVSRQKVLVDARIIVEAVQLRGRGDLEQVLVAGLIFSQQKQVRGGAVEFGVAVLHAARRHVGFQPDDRLDPLAFGSLVKIDHPEHRAVVRDGHRGHVHLLDALDQLLDIREAVEQGVFGVNVKVGEGHVSFVVGELSSLVVDRPDTRASNYKTTKLYN